MATEALGAPLRVSTVCTASSTRAGGGGVERPLRGRRDSRTQAHHDDGAANDIRPRR